MQKYLPWLGQLWLKPEAIGASFIILQALPKLMGCKLL